MPTVILPTAAPAQRRPPDIAFYALPSGVDAPGELVIDGLARMSLQYASLEPGTNIMTPLLHKIRNTRLRAAVVAPGTSPELLRPVSGLGAGKAHGDKNLYSAGKMVAFAASVLAVAAGLSASFLLSSMWALPCAAVGALAALATLFSPSCHIKQEERTALRAHEEEKHAFMRMMQDRAAEPTVH